MVNKVVMGAVGFLVAVVLFGAAMTSFTAQSTTGWTGSVVSVWTLLPLFAILGMGLMLFQFVRGKSG